MDQPSGSQESPEYEELLAQSRSSTSNYSRDSFESTTDEPSWNYDSESFESDTSEPVLNYDSDTFESFSKGNSGEVSFSKSTSITSEAVEEISHRDYTENGLLEKWITILGKQKLQSANSSRPRLSSERSKETPVVSSIVWRVAQTNCTESRNSPLLSYCSMKIQHLRQQSSIPHEKKSHPGQQHRNPTDRLPSCYVPIVIMDRLKTQNVRETMKQVIQAKMHDPASCPDCIFKQAELAKSHFVRTRKTKLEADLMNMKLEEYSYKKDLITYIGEIHQSLPKPSDGGDAIWQRLYTSVRS